MNRQLVDKAPGHVRFLHCLPASRGVEVTDEVLDGSASLAFEQAENRLHTEKAILVWAVNPTLGEPPPEVIRRFRRQAERWLAAADQGGARS